MTGAVQLVQPCQVVFERVPRVEGGGFLAHVPSAPDSCTGFGDTREEALADAGRRLQLVLARRAELAALNRTRRPVLRVGRDRIARRVTPGMSA